MGFKRQRARRRKRAALIVGIVILLIILELIFRIGKEFPVLYETGSDQAYITPTDNFILGYELKRGYEAGIYKINSLGMRDYTSSVEKEEGIFRIATVGDSLTFGVEIELDKTWPKLLERKLQEKISKDIEVYNLGVDAYNSEQEAEYIDKKVLGFKPDLIIIGYSLNDILPVYFLPFDADYQAERNKITDDFVPFHCRFRSELWDKTGQAFIENIILPNKGLDSLTYSPYLSTCKWARVKSAFEKIGKISEENDIPILLVIFPIRHADEKYEKIHLKIVNEAEDNGFYSLDMMDVLEPEFVDAYKDNIHLSELGNLITTNEIVRKLTNETLINID